MKKGTKIQEQRMRRSKRVRARLFGTASRPRLSVFRSNRYISAQLIDDEARATIFSISSKTMGKKTMREQADAVGKAIADSARAKKITAVIFDRGAFLYAGNIQVLAQSAREGGLKF